MRKKLLEVLSLHKNFKMGSKKISALSDISFHLFEGETLGLVGESGCGKTLIAKTLLNIEKKDEGQIFFKGINIDILSSKERKDLCKRMQIIFQDPYSSLNPKMQIIDIIAEPLDIHLRLNGIQREVRVDELLQCVGLKKEHKKRYPHEFSGGQRQRIGIARALALDPELLICDEPVSALDVSTQAIVVNLLKQLQKERGVSLLFISHDLSIVKYISSRILVMYLGHIVEVGDSETIYHAAKHPYTQALLSSIPMVDPVLEKSRTKIVLSGEVPTIFNPPQGCPFHPRCAKAMDICRTKKPKWHHSQEQSVLCHLYSN